MRRLRLAFWLSIMEAVAPLAWQRPQGGWCWRLYLWALGKASDATDWGCGAKLGDQEPW